MGYPVTNGTSSFDGYHPSRPKGRGILAVEESKWQRKKQRRRQRAKDADVVVKVVL